jgi:hypothetical protein
MIVSIEREKSTPSPGKSPRYRAVVRQAKGDHAILISARNFGSVAIAKRAMDDFFATALGAALRWREAEDEGIRVEAVVDATR